MRRIKSMFLLICCILISQGVMAQLSNVYLNVKGDNVCFGVVVKGVGEVILDGYGNVVSVLDNGSHDGDFVDTKYYSGFNDYEAGKIKSIGNVIFKYNSNFRDYEAGKVASIGDVRFTYYSNFNDYEVGKIKTISGVSVKYYSKFNDYEAGKVKSVAGVNLSYYSKFNDYEAGKIKYIDRHGYEYTPGFGGLAGRGHLQSGKSKVTVNGVNFWVRMRR